MVNESSASIRIVPIGKLVLLTDIQINPGIHTRLQLGKHTLIIGRLVGIGLFKLFLGYREDCTFYEIWRATGELKVTMMRGATCSNKVLIFDLNCRQAISDQSIWLAFQSATKGGKLNCLCLQSSIGKQILCLFFFRTHIFSQ
jgi:hypothetical protein